jgi:hypothetical protein
MSACVSQAESVVRTFLLRSFYSSPAHAQVARSNFGGSSLEAECNCITPVIVWV